MPDTGRALWARRIPEPFWWAVLPVVAGFVVSWRSVIRSGGEGAARCSVIDYADLLAAGLGLALVVAGVVAHLRHSSERRCGAQVLLGLVVLLGGLSVYHLLTGLGRIGSLCG